MPTCAECVYMEDPSPTVIRCRLKWIYCYLDTRACESFRPFEGDDERRKKKTRGFGGDSEPLLGGPEKSL